MVYIPRPAAAAFFLVLQLSQHFDTIPAWSDFSLCAQGGATMLYRNNPHLDAQFQKAVRAAHDQDWDAFERFSFYDAKMMEDLLYVYEDFMPLEAKCRFALEHYDNHGDHSAIIRKYVRRARIIRPENWRDALPESVRDLDTFTVYRGSISSIERASFSLS